MVDGVVFDHQTAGVSADVDLGPWLAGEIVGQEQAEAIQTAGEPFSVIGLKSPVGTTLTTQRGSVPDVA